MWPRFIAGLSEDEGYLRATVQELVQDALEAEMDETIGAGRYAKAGSRLLITGDRRFSKT